MRLSKVNLNLKDPKILLSLLLQLSILLLSVAYPLMYPKNANAAVTEGFVRFDRLATGAAVSGTACLKSDAITQSAVTIVFPTGWTINGTTTNWVASTTGVTTQEIDPNGGAAAEAWPGIGASTNSTSVTGLSVTWPTTAFTAGHFYCFYFTGASSTIGSAGNDQTGQLKTQGGNPYTDTENWAVSIVAAAGEQIAVTASVSATMTFTLSGTTAALGTLVTGAVAPNSATAITQSVTTNARNGWVSWIKSAHAGAALHSTAANADITSPGTYNGTPEDLSGAGAGYVVDVNLNTCASCTINAEYDGTADTNNGGHIDNTFHETAYHYGAETALESVDLRVRAKAAATTPAATDYSDTLTVTAAGSF